MYTQQPDQQMVHVNIEPIALGRMVPESNPPTRRYPIGGFRDLVHCKQHRKLERDGGETEYGIKLIQ